MLPTAEDTSASFLEAHEADFNRQVQWYLLVRVAVALAGLITLLIYEEAHPRRFPAAYALLVIGVGITTLHLVIVHVNSAALEHGVVAAVVIDMVIESLLVYLTGGIYNLGFALLFFGTILSAVILISERAGLLAASAATVSLAITALLYWSASNSVLWGDPGNNFSLLWVPPEFYGSAVDLRWGRVTANLIGAGFAFHGVAFLAARLPYRVSESRILFSEILERMGEGLVAIDRRGTIVLANAEARRLLNWHHLHVVAGHRFDRVLRRREDQVVLNLLARGEDAEADLELMIRGHGPVSVAARTTVLRDPLGRVRGVIGIFHDRSLHKQLEETERRLDRLADTEAMALGIAHEIRNPLGSIRGAIQELADHALTDPGDQRLAEIVRRESNRLDRILQQFLDFARMRPPLRQRTALTAVVEEVAELLRRRDKADDVRIEVLIETEAVVEIDPDQLRQALMNVGLNGLEALAGAGHMRIVVRNGQLQERVATPGGSRLAMKDAVEICLENDGPPLSPELAAQVFTPFFTTKRGGLGLGMAITQKILRSHRGDVTAGSSELGGAAFRLLLPRQVAPETIRSDDQILSRPSSRLMRRLIGEAPETSRGAKSPPAAANEPGGPGSEPGASEATGDEPASEPGVLRVGADAQASPDQDASGGDPPPADGPRPDDVAP